MAEADLMGDCRRSDLNEVAREVLEGKWGNGKQREKQLTDVGYSYPEIQKIVTDIVNGGK